VEDMGEGKPLELLITTTPSEGDEGIDSARETKNKRSVKRISIWHADRERKPLKTPSFKAWREMLPPSSRQDQSFLSTQKSYYTLHVKNVCLTL
jgi:hypothetical protein